MKIVVVGGGVVGASALYFLARAGAETVLVDAAHQGRATDAGAGIVAPWTSLRADDTAWLELANAGARLYPDLVASLAADGETETAYRRVGALLVSTDPAELDAAEPIVRAQRRCPRPVRSAGCHPRRRARCSRRFGTISPPFTSPAGRGWTDASWPGRCAVQPRGTARWSGPAQPSW